jgi:hypothetical protein
MASRRGSKKAGFLSSFTDDGNYLVRPENKNGRPGIFPARDPEGRDVLVKFWPSEHPDSDTDLLEIWRSEIRQLQRLAALPGGEDLLVPMISSGKDGEGFYLILDPGRGSPLETLPCVRSCGGRSGQPVQPRLQAGGSRGGQGA